MANASFETKYESVCRYLREAALLDSTTSVLSWDERTRMPPGGAEYRAEQITLLAGMVHQKRTDPKLGEQIDELLASSEVTEAPESDPAVTLKRLKRDYDKKTKLPARLVEELARTAVLGQSQWDRARAEDDFDSFAPVLEKVFALKREEADALGYDECRYDALLDDYEPEMTTAEIRTVLGGLRDELVPFLAEIAESKVRPDTSMLERAYPIDRQKNLARELAVRIGFDFDRGRIDETTHPMCAELGAEDCRISTRYDEQFLPSALFSVLHEGGHALYEQGLPTELFGLPLGTSVSLGIHESQSRLWENLVGRSLAFWRGFYPRVQGIFHESLHDVPLERFYQAINTVKPSLIRVEADEATYNLHIMIRFELELALLDEQLSVADLPGAWNDLYRQYLGIEPSGDAEGVLQDVHWSAGLVGYFPTYALGNLYASQFFEQAAADLGPWDESFEEGQFEPLRDWLYEKIHRHGQRYFAENLVQRVTGAPLSHEPLLKHLKGKFGPIYGLHYPPI